MKESRGVTRCRFDCRFYQHDVPPHLLKADWQSTGSQCRRRAPRSARYAVMFVEWPRVPAADWCGEFKPRHNVSVAPCSTTSQRSAESRTDGQPSHYDAAWANWANREAERTNEAEQDQ